MRIVLHTSLRNHQRTAEQGCAEGVVAKSSTTGNQQSHILFEIAIMPLDTKYVLGLTTAWTAQTSITISNKIHRAIKAVLLNSALCSAGSIGEVLVDDASVCAASVSALLCSEHTSYAQDGIFCGNSHLWITDLCELSLIFFINALCIAMNCGITLFAKENKKLSI